MAPKKSSSEKSRAKRVKKASGAGRKAPPGRKAAAAAKRGRRRSVRKLDYDRFLTILNEEEEKVKENLRRLGVSEDHIETGAVGDAADAASKIESQAVFLGIASTEMKKLIAVSAAREKIRNPVRRREFGTCETCGGEIHEERLEVVPWASICLECGRREERGS